MTWSVTLQKAVKQKSSPHQLMYHDRSVKKQESFIMKSQLQVTSALNVTFNFKEIQTGEIFRSRKNNWTQIAYFSLRGFKI